MESTRELRKEEFMRALKLLLIVPAMLCICSGCREAVVRTHAFSHSVQNYDPDLVRIEITPAEITARAGSEVTLVATTIGKDGKPAAGKRVEWMICRSPKGVGEIVAVDESGIFLADRGAKFDNVFAVTYTNQFDHAFEKAREGGIDIDTLVGKKSPDEIKKGQTWVTITAPSPGETHVMVYAPGIRDAAKGKAFAVIRWK